jgi:hypothetical protein
MSLSWGAEASYLAQAASGLDDYYARVGQSVGRWVGHVSAGLGLGGEVSGDDLRAVPAGPPTPARPDGDRKATPRSVAISYPASPDRSAGWEQRHTTRRMIALETELSDAIASGVASHTRHTRARRGDSRVRSRVTRRRPTRRGHATVHPEQRDRGPHRTRRHGQHLHIGHSRVRLPRRRMKHDRRQAISARRQRTRNRCGFGPWLSRSR